MKKYLYAFIAFILPVVSHAAEVARFQEVRNIFGQVTDFINTILVPFVFAAAFIVFLYGIFKTFILGASEEEKQKEGKQLMLYSVIGFVFMLSIWGIVNLFAEGLGLNETGPSFVPTVNIEVQPR